MPDQYSKLVGHSLKYPYLVGITTESGDLGTGILISARFVLTCGHVLDDSPSAVVISRKGRTTARVQKIDDSLDLALLELPQPISAPKAQFTDVRLQPGAALLAVGVQATPGQPGQLSVAEIELKFRNKNDADGQILDIQLEGGARPGYSGGPLVVERGGASLCIGVMRFGGPGASISNAIGLASIRAFVSEYVPDIAEEKLRTTADTIRRPLMLTAILFAIFVLGAITKWFYMAWHNPKVPTGAVIVDTPAPKKTPVGQSTPGKKAPTDPAKVPSQTSADSTGPKYIALPQPVAGPHALDQGNPDVSVWVNTASNVYHCPGTRSYGKTMHGQYMSQADARKKANRPAYGKVCK